MQHGAGESITGPDDVMLAALRLSLRELRLYGSDGQPVPVERKAFDLLAYLVAHRNRVVGKDELLVAVWGREVASDSVIAQAVSKARKALAAGGGDPAWIDVARGSGYRYIGPMEPVLPIDDEVRHPTQPTAASRRPQRWRALAAVAALGMAVGLGVAWHHVSLNHDPLRIAILPWRNDTGDTSLDWTRLGLQGLVADALASDRRLEPVSPSSIDTLLSARPDLNDARAQAEYLGTAAGATHVFAGRLLRDETGLQVELVVMGSPTGTSLNLVGDDASSLALAASANATRGLLAGSDPRQTTPLSSIAFANEALARGIDARLRGDAQTAIRHLHAAIAADPHLLAARYQLSLALQAQRRNDDWRLALDELLAMAKARADRMHQGHALSGQGLLAWREGRLDEARALIGKARDLFDGDNDGLRRAAADGNLGSLAAMRGDFDQAEQAMLRALRAFERAGQQADIARTSKNLGILALDRGQFEQAARWIERSLDIRQKLGLERDLAESLSALASIDLARERPVAAQASYQRAAAIFERYRDPLMESDTLARLSNTLVAQGLLGDAQVVAARSLAAARSADNPAARCLAQIKLASIARQRSDREGAANELDRALLDCQAARDRRGLIHVDLERAELALHSDAAVAATAVQAALDAAREQGDRMLTAEALLLQSRLPNLATEQAQHLLARCGELAREIGNPSLLTRVSCMRVALPGVTDDPIALATCQAAGMRNAQAAAALARRALAHDNRDDAVHWLRQQRRLAGEAWQPADETLWRQLISAPGDDGTQGL